MSHRSESIRIDFSIESIMSDDRVTCVSTLNLIGLLSEHALHANAKQEIAYGC